MVEYSRYLTTHMIRVDSVRACTEVSGNSEKRARRTGLREARVRRKPQRYDNYVANVTQACAEPAQEADSRERCQDAAKYQDARRSGYAELWAEA
jgi:hypothetical protein